MSEGKCESLVIDHGNEKKPILDTYWLKIYSTEMSIKQEVRI